MKLINKKIFKILFIIFIVVLFFPIIWLISVSLKLSIDIFTIPPTFFSKISFENYYNVIFKTNILQNIYNSFIVAISSSLIALIIGTPAAYGISRYKKKLSLNLSFTILSFKFLPPIVMAIPFFILFKNLSLSGTLLAVILSHILLNLPFVVWIMTSFFNKIPEELEDIAKIDGYSNYKIFIYLILPISKFYLLITGIFCMIFSWNEFLFGFILTTFKTRTAPVSILRFVTEKGIMWGEIAAFAVLITIPIIILSYLLYLSIKYKSPLNLFKKEE